MLHGRSLEEAERAKKRRLAEEEGPNDLESLPEKKDLEEQEQQQEGTRISFPAGGAGPKELESPPEKKDLEEQEQQQEGTRISAPAGRSSRPTHTAHAQEHDRQASWFGFAD